MGYHDHKDHVKDQPPVPCAVITVSDTRTPETDRSGATIRDLLQTEGHPVVHYEVLPDEPEQIAARIRELCERDDCRAIIVNGGTGISRRDGTYEAVRSLLDKELPGFGELFRMISYQEIGAGAMLSRATAGIRGSTLIFSTPGSTNAVRTAMTKLILPELKHLVWEVLR